MLESLLLLTLLQLRLDKTESNSDLLAKAHTQANTNQMAFRQVPPQPAGTWGYGVPPAVRMTGQESADSRSSRFDLGLGVISLSAAMVATGLTASCLAAKTCHETVPLTAWAFDRGPVWGVVGRAGVNGLIHYAVARWIPKGKWRTATLATLAVINVTNAVLDTRTLMEIERQKAMALKADK